MPELGTTYTEVDKGNQATFDFLPAAKKYGPETSHIAAEKVTVSGKRETDCLAILRAMKELNATWKRPVTGAQIAHKAGMTVVEVMRRMRTDLEKYGSGIVGCTNSKRFCQLTYKPLLGWWLK